MKKLKLVEDQVNAEEDTMQEIDETLATDTPRRRRKKRRKEDGTPRRSYQKTTGDEPLTIPVPDSEMDTETDKDATTIDSNNVTSASQPERSAEAQKRHELEILGKRERLDREINERVSTPLGSITCKKCRDVMPSTMTRCPRCDAYNVLNETDSFEEKKKQVMTACTKLLRSLHVAADAAQNVYLNDPENSAPPPIGFSTRFVENWSARGNQPKREPKSVPWMREWVRRLDNWKKKENITARPQSCDGGTSFQMLN